MPEHKHKELDEISARLCLASGKFFGKEKLENKAGIILYFKKLCCIFFFNFYKIR